MCRKEQKQKTEGFIRALHLVVDTSPQLYKIVYRDMARKSVVVIRGKIFSFKMYTTFMEMSVTFSLSSSLRCSFHPRECMWLSQLAKGVGKYFSVWATCLSLHIALHFITLHHITSRYNIITTGKCLVLSLLKKSACQKIVTESFLL